MPQQQPEPYHNIHKPRARTMTRRGSEHTRADPAARMEDDDDFTFPTTVAATTVAKERRDVVVDGVVATPATGLGDRLPLLPVPAPPGASRLWPFAPLIDNASTAATSTGKEDEEAPAPTRRKEEEEREQQRATAAADEDRMDMLWDDTAAATTTTTAAAPAPAPRKSTARAEPAAPERRAPVAKPAADEERAAAVAEQERMDMLWESFNEDLLLRRAGRSNCKAADEDKQQRISAGGLDDPDTWYLCPSSTWSDAESDGQETSASASSPRYGCAPTMLRASSRAGGAAQFYGGGGGSPRRRRGSRGGGWALLLRLFRRLFAVDNKAPSRRHGIHVP